MWLRKTVQKSKYIHAHQTCVPSHSIERLFSCFKTKTSSNNKNQTSTHIKHIKQCGMFVNKTGTCTVAIFGCSGWQTTFSPKSFNPNFNSPFSTKMAARSNQQKRRFIILRFHGKPTIFSSKKHFTWLHNHFIQLLYVMSRGNL